MTAAPISEPDLPAGAGQRRPWRRGITRAVAAVASIGLLYPVLWMAFFISLSAGAALQAPDPFVPDHSFSATPDDWTEVWTWLAESLIPVGIALALLTAIFGLFRFGFAGRRTRLRTFARIPLIGGAATLAIYGIVLLTMVGKGRPEADCGTFRFDAAAWRSGPVEAPAWNSGGADGGPIPVAHLTKGFALAQCGTLRGKTRSQVDAMLGSRHADHQLDHDGTGFSTWDDLTVEFEHGRVARTQKPTVPFVDDF